MGLVVNTAEMNVKDKNGQYVPFNMIGGTPVVIDKTLTKDSQAADAKVTGDRLNDIQDNMILVSETEPESDVNRLWVKESDNEIIIPTMDDLTTDKTLSVEDKPADAKAVGLALQGKVDASSYGTNMSEIYGRLGSLQGDVGRLDGVKADKSEAYPIMYKNQSDILAIQSQLNTTDTYYNFTSTSTSATNPSCCYLLAQNDGQNVIMIDAGCTIKVHVEGTGIKIGLMYEESGSYKAKTIIDGNDATFDVPSSLAPQKFVIAVSGNMQYASDGDYTQFASYSNNVLVYDWYYGFYQMGSNPYSIVASVELSKPISALVEKNANDIKDLQDADVEINNRIDTLYDYNKGNTFDNVTDVKVLSTKSVPTTAIDPQFVEIGGNYEKNPDGTYSFKKCVAVKIEGSTTKSYVIDSRIQALPGYGLALNDKYYNYINLKDKTYIQWVAQSTVNSSTWDSAWPGECEEDPVHLFMADRIVSQLVDKDEMPPVFMDGYETVPYSEIVKLQKDKVVSLWDEYVLVYDSAYSTASAFRSGKASTKIYTAPLGIQNDISSYIGELANATVEPGSNVTFYSDTAMNNPVPVVSQITYTIKPQLIEELNTIKNNGVDKVKLTEAVGNIRFGIDENGNYGYYKDGADTVTPFKSGGGDVIYNNQINAKLNATNYYLQDGILTINSTYNGTTIDIPHKMLHFGNNPWEVCFNFTAKNWSSLTTYPTIVGSSKNTGSIDNFNLIIELNTAAHTLRTIIRTTEAQSLVIAGTTELANATNYYVKVVYDKTSYKMYLSTDGHTWNLENEILSSQVINDMDNDYSIGSCWNGTSQNTFFGTIDLTKSYVKIDNKIAWGYNAETYIPEIADLSHLQYLTTGNIDKGLQVSNMTATGINTNYYLPEHQSPYELQVKFKLNDFERSINGIFGGTGALYSFLRCEVNANGNGKVTLCTQASWSSGAYDVVFPDGTFSIQKWYWLRVSVNTTAMTVYVSDNGKTFTEIGSVALGGRRQYYSSGTKIMLGGFANASDYELSRGRIDLSECYIKQNNMVVWGCDRYVVEDVEEVKF